MKYLNLIPKFLLISAMLLLGLSACSESDSVLQSTDQDGTDYEALMKLIDEDESLQSFEPNYNEEDVMDFTGSLAKEIFPVRVGQRMRRIDHNLDVVFEGDTAFGTITTTFAGILFIAASYDEWTPGDSGIVDTLIQKEFTTVITRNAMFVKVENNINPLRNWRIAAISLPEGGTGSANINITYMTIFLPDGSTIEVDDPNEYYLSRFPGQNGQIPILNPGDEVTVQVKVQSAYADTDFVSLTYGAFRSGPHHRAKRLFELVDETFDGTMYMRTFEQSWIIGRFPGHRHAIINAMPKQVIFDDSTPVETNSWGMPYAVR